MKRGRSEAETCHMNGWAVGARLVGDEGYGPTVILITAIGEGCLLARAVSHNGVQVRESETTWTLTCRDWRELEPGENA